MKNLIRSLLPLLLCVRAFAVLTDVPPMPYGQLNILPSSATGSTFDLDSATDAVGMFVAAPKTGTIIGMRVYVSAVDGTAPTYKCWLGTATTGDQISATPVGGGSPAQLLTSTWSTGLTDITFTNSYSATAGEVLTLGIMHSSGTVDASNNIQVRYGINHITEYYSHPTMATSTGTWADDSSLCPMMALLYDDGTMSFPYNSCNNGLDIASGWDATSDATTSLWRGTHFTPSVGCRIIGAYVSMRNASSYGWTGALYDSSNDQLSSCTFSADDIQGAWAGTLMYIPFDPVELTADTAYRIVMKPDTANEFTDVLGFQYDASADREEVFPGMYYTESSTVAAGVPSAWTGDNTANGPILIPVIDQIDIPEGGGGGGTGRAAGR